MYAWRAWMRKLHEQLQKKKEKKKNPNRAITKEASIPFLV